MSEGNRMATGITSLVSPRAHRRIDQFTFPGLIAAAAAMARVDRRAAAVILATAAVEGTAYLITDYPPAVLPLMSFTTHNRVAAAHGALVIGLGLTVPGISWRGRLALCALGSMPIALAALSDTRGPQGGHRAVVVEVGRPCDTEPVMPEPGTGELAGPGGRRISWDEAVTSHTSRSST